jgi:hypothetical protein
MTSAGPFANLWSSHSAGANIVNDTQKLTLGRGYHELDGRFDEVFPTFSTEDHHVHLVATVLKIGAPATSHATPLPETTVGIRMEPEAAMKLLANLENLAQKMGWPHPR